MLIYAGASSRSSDKIRTSTDLSPISKPPQNQVYLYHSTARAVHSTSSKIAPGFWLPGAIITEQIMSKQKREERRVRARTLYLQDKKSPADIAAMLGVDVATVFRWKRTEKWDQDLVETLRTGATLREKLFAQLNTKVEELARDGGSPDGIAKLWKVIKELDPTIDRLGNTIKTMEDFVSFLGEQYPAALKALSEPIERFLDFARDRG